MLHIITIAWNEEYLEKIFESFPQPFGKHDILWWVSVTSEVHNKFRGVLGVHEIETELPTIGADHRVNPVFDLLVHIKRSGDFFMFVDNDTIFHPNAYRLYQLIKGTESLVIGKQVDSKGETRLTANLPAPAKIDTGNVICTTKVVDAIRWKYQPGDEAPDGQFWMNCAKYLGEKNVFLFDEVISIYNAQIVT